MSNVLEQFELSVGSFGQDRCREGLHDLFRDVISQISSISVTKRMTNFLDRNRARSQIIACRTDESECTHPHWLEVHVASGDLEYTVEGERMSQIEENRKMDKIGQRGRRRRGELLWHA